MQEKIMFCVIIRAKDLFGLGSITFFDINIYYSLKQQNTMDDKKNQTIKADLYFVVDIFIIIAIVFIIIGIIKKEKIYGVGMVSTGIIAGLIFLLQMYKGKSVVHNMSNEVIYAKPEEGTEPVAVPPHGELYDIDGFKANGKVYKISDGVHARVFKNGITMVTSITGYIISKLRGGVILSAPKDGGWQKLFDR